MQGLFGANSLPDLIYHDYPPSPQSSFFQGSSPVRNCSYMCTFQEKKKKERERKEKKRKEKKKTCTDYLSKLSKNELPVGLVIQFQ